jgi:ribosomal protein L37AE/L43A
MYITDLKHFLDSRGAIGPTKGPARAMAQFQTDVVASASNAAGDAPAPPTCFKCKKSAVQTALARDDAVVWKCPRCETEGRISNWQGSLWDLRDRPAPPA